MESDVCMRKQDLQQGMIVKTSDGRYGVVCIRDATDSNCIKFFYDPMLKMAHGSVEKANCGEFVVPLNRFTDDLKYICSKKEARELGLIPSHMPLTLWSIKEVFSLQREWTRTTCMASCSHLAICKETYDQDTIGCCKFKDGAFIGTMEEIHSGGAQCIAENEIWGKSRKLDYKEESVSDMDSSVSSDTRRL